jgi:1,4-dihydroxy-2-naphthoate octaprenyltransferase
LADPKISITSAACMVIGASGAAVDGPISWSWLVATGIAFFAMEVAKNAWGEVFDFDSGTDLAVATEDRTDFSGGKRVLVDGLLSRRQTWGMALGFGFTGIAVGAIIVFLREPTVFWVGVVGLVLGWSYHGPPLKLAYRGLGELDVVLCYGPLLSVSTYIIQVGAWSWNVFWLSLPLGIFIAAFLWINEFPDYAADRSAGKSNLVARLGRTTASRVLPLIYAVGFLMLLAWPLFGLPWTVVLGFIGLPPAVYACARVWGAPDTFHRRHPAQAAALLVFVAYSLGAGAGLVLGGS